MSPQHLIPNGFVLTLWCKEGLRRWLKEKCHAPAQVQPETTSMCASGVLVQVDKRITPQAQDAKVRVQGAKVRTTTFNYNHDRPGTTQQALQLA